MQHFKIKKDGFKEVRKTLLLRLIPLVLIVFLAVWFISIRGAKTSLKAEIMTDSLLAVVLVFSIYRSMLKQKKLFESYQLVVDEHGLVRELLNTPSISIPFEEIKSVVKNKNGTLTIQGMRQEDLIGVPAQLEQFAAVEEMLSTYKQVDVQSQDPLIAKLTIPITLLALVCMGVVYVSDNKILVGICGTSLTILMIYGFVEIQKSKNIDRSVKRSSYFIFFVLISIIATAVVKLFYR